MHGLATSLSASGAAAILEEIDLSEQPGLKGNVLEVLFKDCVLPNLRTINLSGCQNAICVIPHSITKCSSLTTLNLRKCGHECKCHKLVSQPMMANITHTD